MNKAILILVSGPPALVTHKAILSASHEGFIEEDCHCDDENGCQMVWAIPAQFDARIALLCKDLLSNEAVESFSVRKNQAYSA